jgi:hypothetical protein
LQKIGYGFGGFVGIQLGFNVPRRGADPNFADGTRLGFTGQGPCQCQGQGKGQSPSCQKAKWVHGFSIKTQ